MKTPTHSLFIKRGLLFALMGLIVLFWIGGVHDSHAQTITPSTNGDIGIYEPISPIPGIGGTINLKENTGNYFQKMFQFALGIAGILAVLMIVIGGIQYMMSDAFTSKEDAKKRIWGALWGLLLLFASVIILETINPALLNLQLGLPALNPSAPPSIPQPAYSEREVVNIPPNFHCKDVKGAGWVTLNTNSCTPPAGFGQECCGRQSATPQPGQELPETQKFTPGDTSIQNFINQCEQNGGRWSARCTRESFEDGKETCEEVEYRCPR